MMMDNMLEEMRFNKICLLIKMMI